jgi:exopolyphosphatase/guanosine-5'-triphosphate,3'-diphosphate pyrophosphatase
MPNFAAIDVGSNAIRMLVSRLEADGKLDTLENIRLPIRLGQDAFTSGLFSERTMQMAVEAFVRFRQVAGLFEVQRIKAVATSAMRESSNRDILIDRILQETGIQVEVISGEDEARLVHLAVKHAIDIHDKTALIIDIGGGSIEVLLTHGDSIISTESFDMGTVRMLSKLNSHAADALPLTGLIREYTATAHRYLEQEIGDTKIQLCAGTGGNLEELGRLRKRVLNKHRTDLVTRSDLTYFGELFTTMSYDDRIEKLGLNPDRADVILPAVIVLEMILAEAKINEILIPGVGLKDGVLLDMLPLPTEPKLPRRLQVLASVQQMGRKYAYDARHADNTAFLATRLFDQTLSLHHLTENERLILEAAAMLHDIGHFINTIDHDQHGYYLLMNHPLIGMTPGEQEMVANLVLVHRMQTLMGLEEGLASRSQKDRVILSKLSAILHIADALDTSHQERVQDITIEQRSPGVWHLFLQTTSESLLEKWALIKRKLLFEEVFGVTLEFD